MKKDTRAIIIGLLWMIFIIVIIWAFNTFVFRFLPSNYDNPYIILVFFAGIIGTFVTVIKGITLFVDLLKPRKDEPDEIEKLLGELRGLQSISDKKAQSYVLKILGEDSSDFWIQLKYHKNAKILNELIQDPFMLEGLLCVYRTKQGKLPQNIGALLDNLIRTQWVPEKLLLDNWIPIESVLWALGELVYSHVPEQRYPIWHEFTSNKDSFKNMLIQIGTKENDWLRKINKSELEYKILDQFDRNNPHLFDKVISTILIYLFYFWSHNIFCKIRNPGKIRWAKRLLQAAENAHLIHLDEVYLHFNHKFWVDYFAARFIVHYSNMIPEHLYDGVNSGARNLDDKFDIAEIICGLLDNPFDFIRTIIPMNSNKHIAAQCILSGVDGIPIDLVHEVAESLRIIVGDEYNGRELRRANCAKLLQQLMGDPSDIDKILQGMQWVPSDFKDMMAKTIVLYGSNSVEILLKNLEHNVEQKNNYDQDVKYYIIIALGWIGDRRAIEPLRRQLISEQTGLYTSILILAILATHFEDKQATSEFLQFLLFQRDNEFGRSAWWKLYKLGEDAVLWGVKTIMGMIEIKSFQMSNALGMCLKIAAGFPDNQLLGKFLLKKYKQINNNDELVFILNMFGAIKLQEAEDILFECRQNPNSKIKAAAIDAYRKLPNSNVATLIDALNDYGDISNVRNAIFALGKLDSNSRGISIAVNGLTRRLFDTDINEDNEQSVFDLYPTAMLIIDALISINTPEALQKATEWCVAHLDSERSARYAGYKLLSDVAYFYLQYKIETEEAEEIAKEWSKHKLEQTECTKND